MSELFSSSDGNGSLAWQSNDSATPLAPPFSQAAMVSIGIVLAVIVTLTIAGNVLVLLAIAITPHLRGTTNYLVGSLAIADLMLGLLVLPFSAFLELTNYWSFGILFCDIWAAVDVLCCTASINSLCVISIDRYIGVTRPLQYPTIVTPRRSLITIVAVWLVSLALSLAPLIGWPKEPDPPGNCTVEKDRAYVIFSATISFYIPLAIICILYCQIYRTAAAQSRLLSKGRIQVKTSSPGSTSAESECMTLRVHYGGQAGIAATEAGKMARFKREQKAAKTLAIVVGVFAGCWSPFFILLPIEAYIPGTVPEPIFDFFFWLGYCNSCLNPFIYAFSSREFNAAFRRILRCQFRRYRGIPGNPVVVKPSRGVGNSKPTASPARLPTSASAQFTNHRTGPSDRPARQPTLRIKTDDGDIHLDLLEESRV